MSDYLPFTEAVERFGGNEERIHQFVNDPANTGAYTDSEGRQVETLPVLAARSADLENRMGDATDPTDPTKAAAILAFKQDSPSAVPTNAYNKLSYFVEAEDYGAKGNGIDDDTLAIRKALDEKKYVLLRPGRTYVVHGLDSVERGALMCIVGRAKIRVPDGIASYGFRIIHSNFDFCGVDIDGGDMGPYNTPLAPPPPGERVGLHIGNSFGTGAQLQNISVQNSEIYGFDYAGMYGAEVQIGFVFGHRVSFHNVNCHHNYVNWWLSPRFEYIQGTLCYGYEGYVGILVQAGNIKFTGGAFENNAENCQLATGENDAHGGFVNTSFNHAIGWGLRAANIQNGMAFTGCFFWYGPIELNNCTGIQIRNGEIVNSPITIAGGGVNSIDDNYTRDPITPTLIGYTFTTFRRNRTSSTDTSFVPVYGDVYAQAQATGYGALPTAISTAGAKVSLNCVYGTLKWQGADAPWLQLGSKLAVGRTGMYQVDASLTLTIGDSDEIIGLSAARYNSASELMEEFPVSSPYGAGEVECSVSLSNRMLCQTGDTIDFLISTRTASNSTLNKINVKVSSVD